MEEGILNIDKYLFDNVEELKKKKEEIKVGYYIKTDEDYGITKVIQKDDIGFITSDYRRIPYTDAQQIKKYSKNIYDLLDNEDLVELEYNNYSERECGIFQVKKYSDNHLLDFGNYIYIFTYDLLDKKFMYDENYDLKLKSVLKIDEYHRNCYKEV